jgi:prepilin-type N-terminal cleavage/methylation domain-containing protein
MTRFRNADCPARNEAAFGAQGRVPVPQLHVKTAFTLIEVLLALAISAVVLVAIQAVFATAVRLRDKTSYAIDESLPINAAFDIMRADLKGAVGPYGILAGPFKCGVGGMGSTMGASVNLAGIGLDFYSATGLIADEAPWGDLQEVFYQLVPPSDRSQPGQNLVRNVNRNVLGANNNQQVPETDLLMTQVESLDIECYDGFEWRTTWDTTQSDTNLPQAVLLRITPVAKENQDPRAIQPLQMLVQLTIQTRTNLTLTSTNNLDTNSVSSGQ